MPQVRRYDRTTLRTDGKRTPQGYLLCDAAIARTGVQVYVQPDGTKRREYRPPEEVFHPDALGSFALAPLTLGHPEELVTAANTDKYSKGIVAGPKQDGHLVRATVQVMHPDAIRAAETGDAAELSCGYLCDLDMTPGVAPNGEKYDAVQRNIRGNHVAQVRRGRAGAEVRLRMDAADAEQFEPINPEPAKPGLQTKKDETMEKIVIDGVEVEVTALAAQLIRKSRKDAEDKRTAELKVHADAVAALEAKVASATAEAKTHKDAADSFKGKFEVAEAARIKADKERTDAIAPEAISALVAARVDIETMGRAVLGSDAKLAGKTPIAIKKDCMAKLAPDLKLDGKSDAQIEGAFDYAYSTFAKQNPAALARAGAIAPPVKKADGGNAEEPKDPRAEFMASQNKGDADELPGMRASDVK